MKVNEIAAASHSTPDSCEYLALFVDGQPLDGLLDTLVPGESLGGLIPAFHVEPLMGEVRVVLSRFMPSPGAISIAPVLVCPEDLDFCCSLVVAEVACEHDQVRWIRVGYDLSMWRPDPEFVGEHVRWFGRCPPFVFRRESYAAVLAQFAAAISPPAE